MSLAFTYLTALVSGDRLPDAVESAGRIGEQAGGSAGRDRRPFQPY